MKQRTYATLADRAASLRRAAAAREHGERIAEAGSPPPIKLAGNPDTATQTDSNRIRAAAQRRVETHVKGAKK